MKDIKGVMNMIEKPPLGVKPKYIWELFVLSERKEELERAIKDRIGTKWDIPKEWIEERSEILKRLKALRVNI